MVPELIECDILSVDVCDKMPRSATNPFEDASYYHYHRYTPLDGMAEEPVIFDSTSSTAPTGELMVVSKVIPVNESSSAPFWINDTVEVFRTCPEYSDDVGFVGDPSDPNDGIVIIGRNFRDSPLLSCRWTPCIGDSEYGMEVPWIFGLERRCRNARNGDFFRDFHDGSYLDSFVVRWTCNFPK